MKNLTSFALILAAGFSLTYMVCPSSFGQDVKQGNQESKKINESSDKEVYKETVSPPMDPNYKPTSEDIARLEIYEIGNRPSKTFRLISPVGAKQTTEEKAFAKLKETAAKMHADAIIDYQCGPAPEHSSWSGLIKIRAYCNGKAVNWVSR